MRAHAEALALKIARECERTGVKSEKMVQGKQFAAIGGWGPRGGPWPFDNCDDPGGIWHFAVETRTPSEIAEVRAWFESIRA